MEWRRIGAGWDGGGGVGVDVNVGIEGDSLDLVGRTVRLRLCLSVHFQYNTSFSSILVWVNGDYASLSYYLNKTASTGEECWFAGTFYPRVGVSGAPELFPFDFYGVNVTVWLEHVPLGEGLKGVYFQCFLQDWEIVDGRYSAEGEGLELIVVFTREAWQGIPYLLPVLVGFIALGFSSLLGERRNGGYAMRIEVCLALLIWSVGFSFLVFPMVPSSASFLSLGELLGYALSCSVLSFLVFTIISREVDISSAAADFLSIIFPLGLTALLLESVLPYAWYKHQAACHVVVTLVAVIWLSLASGLIFRGARSFHTHLARYGLRWPRITHEELRAKSWFLYWAGFLIDMTCLGMTVYWVGIFGPGVEMTPLRRLLFEVTLYNPLLMFAAHISLIAGILLPSYYAPQIAGRVDRPPITRRNGVILSNGLGVLFLLVSILALINDAKMLTLLPDPLLAYTVGAIACGVAALLFTLFGVKGQPTETQENPV